MFKDGGFDFVVGNPPWVRMQWEAANAISDANPKYAVQSISASDLNRKLPELLKSQQTYGAFISEYVATAGQLAFYNAIGDASLLQGQQTNLFRCFLPNAWRRARANMTV